MSKLMEYIKDYMELKSTGSEDVLEVLKSEGSREYVTIEEAGEVILTIAEELIEHIELSQAITEVRLKGIVGSLPIDTQKSIHDLFEQAEDDLFAEEEGEELYNDEEKHEHNE